MKIAKVMRILLTLLGAALILQAAGSLALGIIGERGTAVITHTRRELGERNEAIPNRYTYIISYTFTTPDGQVVSDSTRRIGGAIYVKASGKQQVPVRYWKPFPAFNTLEQDAQPSWGKAAQSAIGLFLIIVLNRPRKKVARSAVKTKSGRRKPAGNRPS